MSDSLMMVRVMDYSEHMVLSAYHLCLPYSLPYRLDAANRRKMCEFVYHACKHFGGKVLWIRAMDHVLHLVVAIPADMSVDDFVDSIGALSQSWMRSFDPLCDFGGWVGNYFIRTLSPEERQMAVERVKSLPDDLPNETLPSVTGLSERHETSQPCNHHIIIAVTRCLMRLNLKFAGLLHETIRDICRGMFCPVRTVLAMREHVHILVSMPVNMSVLNLVNVIRDESQDWMRSNIHFRRVPDWSRAFTAYSVSDAMLDREEYLIGLQPKYHSFGHNYASEIIHLSTLLELPQPDIHSIYYK